MLIEVIKDLDKWKDTTGFMDWEAQQTIDVNSP